MIIACPIGGLANQMCVYAAARALAHHHKVPLKLDLSEIKKDRLRVYELDKLSITAEIATPEEIKSISQTSSNIVINKIKTKLRKRLGLQLGVYKEKKLAYDNCFFDIPDNIYLKGNFMSIQYCNSIQNLLRSEFQISRPLSEDSKQWLELIKSTESVSLHIRRGDYADNPKTKAFHGLLNLDYYKKAIEVIRKKVANPTIYVFSDDLNGVRNNLNSDITMHFVDANDSNTGFQDYHLMMACNHHIIANSGFSRWPAFLNEKEGKVVCMPETWFLGESLADSDIAPSDWIRVPC